jgi:acetolactate synthase-1/2/3 large subunit
MNQLSGAEAFVRMLQLHGVRHVFGLCGDTSLPLYDALYRLDHGMTHILARDERSRAIARPRSTWSPSRCTRRAPVSEWVA